MELFTKLKISLRHRLLGMASLDQKWELALEAFDFAEETHVGYRKDGKTPEFLHQIQIALFLLSHIKNLVDPVGVIVAALLHDTSEDYDIDFERIESKFGKQAAIDVRCLTKKFRGVMKDKQTCFDEIADSQNASVVKGVDRINNISTMIGVFSKDKQISYCQETRDYFFAFLKAARRKFVRQDAVYENIKFCLEIQLKLFEEMNK